MIIYKCCRPLATTAHKRYESLAALVGEAENITKEGGTSCTQLLKLVENN